MSIELDDTITDMVISKKHYPAVTELFIRDTKQNISLVLNSLSYFAMPKDSKKLSLTIHLAMTSKISDKEPPSIMIFISEKNINSEIMNELENIKERKQKKIYIYMNLNIYIYEYIYIYI